MGKRVIRPAPSAINYSNLSGAEALLHQVQMGKRDVARLVNPSYRQTPSYAVVLMFAVTLYLNPGIKLICFQSFSGDLTALSLH